jgi:hypothetical protein
VVVVVVRVELLGVGAAVVVRVVVGAAGVVVVVVLGLGGVVAVVGACDEDDEVEDELGVSQAVHGGGLTEVVNGAVRQLTAMPTTGSVIGYGGGTTEVATSTVLSLLPVKVTP